MRVLDLCIPRCRFLRVDSQLVLVFEDAVGDVADVELVSDRVSIVSFLMRLFSTSHIVTSEIRLITLWWKERSIRDPAADRDQVLQPHRTTLNARAMQRFLFMSSGMHLHLNSGTGWCISCHPAFVRCLMSLMSCKSWVIQLPRHQKERAKWMIPPFLVVNWLSIVLLCELLPQFQISFGKNIAADFESAPLVLACIRSSVLANWFSMINACQMRSSRRC